METKNAKRLYRCKCARYTLFQSTIPSNCTVCDYCGSTLSTSEKYRDPEQHKFKIKIDNPEFEVCEICNVARRVNKDWCDCEYPIASRVGIKSPNKPIEIDVYDLCQHCAKYIKPEITKNSIIEPHNEELLEQLYWEWDSERQKGNERISFKGKLRWYAEKFHKEQMEKK